jgi:hypothetical protein
MLAVLFRYSTSMQTAAQKMKVMTRVQRLMQPSSSSLWGVPYKGKIQLDDTEVKPTCASSR